MARTRFYRSWGQTVERLPNIQSYVRYEPDPKLRIARAMWRETKTYAEIAQAIGMTESKCRIYLREHGMVRGDRRFGPKGKPPSKQEKEEEMAKDRNLIRKEAISPNGMKISYPAWHDEAREMRKTMTIQQVAAHFGVSAGRISQIVSPMWMAHTMRETKYVGRPIAEIAKELGFNITEKPKRVAFKNVAKPVAEIVKPEQVTQIGETQPMAHHRVFEKYYFKDSSDRRNAVQIKCHKCGKINFFAKHGVIAHDHARKNFLHKGWVIGSGPGGDTCAECLAMIKEGKRAAADPKSMAEALFKPKTALGDALANATMLQSPGVGIEITENKPNKPAPAPVGLVTRPVEKVMNVAPKPLVAAKEMDLASRRLILLKLNEVYSETGTGYTAGWTDAKVATDMGVPVEWIAKLRTENFGPEDDPSTAKRKQEIAHVEVAIKGLKEDIVAVASVMKTLKDTLENQAAKNITHLGRLEDLEKRLAVLQGVAWEPWKG